jgi:predicted RNase H-like HicB family nuclease
MRYGKPIKNKKRRDPRYFLHEGEGVEPGTMGVPSGEHSEHGKGYAPTFKTGKEIEGNYYIHFVNIKGQHESWPQGFETEEEAIRQAQDLMDGGRKPLSVSVEQKGEEEYGPVWGLKRK